MKQALVELLQDPASGEALELVAFERRPDVTGEASITEGLLYCPATGAAFPVVGGVPAMIPSAFPRAFIDKHRAALDDITGRVPLRLGSAAGDDFSFSKQWREHYEQHVDRMWGWTVEERLDQLVMEMQVTRDWFRGKKVLDAGCGPGDLTEAIAALGANVVGFDLSSSVYEAERQRRSRTLQFVRADASAAGFKSESFDAVLSLGVVMFTPDPYRSFSEICRLVKPGGRFYVNVDRLPESFVERYVKHPPLDLARRIISRLPDGPQAAAVKAWARMIYGFDTVLHGRPKAPLCEYVLSAHNYLTPRWRHYHTAYELAAWFHGNGFASPSFTHWDNPYAFGLVSIKDKQAATPGVHFGSAPKLWDKKKGSMDKIQFGHEALLRRPVNGS